MRQFGRDPIGSATSCFEHSAAAAAQYSAGMSEENDESDSSAPLTDAAATPDQAAFDEYARMTARTAVWPIGALSAFALSARAKKNP
jgi:hypothetical protein